MDLSAIVRGVLVNQKQRSQRPSLLSPKSMVALALDFSQKHDADFHPSEFSRLQDQLASASSLEDLRLLSNQMSKKLSKHHWLLHQAFVKAADAAVQSGKFDEVDNTCCVR